MHDYQDLEQRHSQRNCKPNTLRDNCVFWGISGSYYGYGAPKGFCFDIQCDEDALYGMEEDALLYRLKNDFLEQLEVQADRTHGTSSNIMFTMDSDFQYENASFYFKSLDILIDTINTKMDSATISTIFPNHDGVNLFHTTPEMYTQTQIHGYTRTRTRTQTQHQHVKVHHDDRDATPTMILQPPS